MEEALPVLFVLGVYLWAGVPSAYLIARYIKGIDIRKYGSGNAGATNVMSQLGKPIGFFVGTFDCLGKGTLPVVAANLLDMSLSVQVAAGLAGIAGHNWSPYIRFTGGRGVATAIGVVLGLQMWQEFLILTVVMGIIGWLIFHESGFWTFVSMLILPVLALVFERPVEILAMTLVIAVLLMAKRLLANREPLPRGYPPAKVLMWRMLWDRDVPRKAEWTKRRPPL